ncbi:MAG: DNA-directed DNA polymerase II small subunit [Candidatus Nanoarchaeia archaeon]|nr:DNA-directed DNA polymerase II small subunit [Candidatus Haiyanarchaeum thermophilum]MCW1303248.1 DNA-directed DNA polymerase II small subunit [Candidatus Haiyanarchaeum thermophilum]MCW1304020.1 DNA-directed DNA polymerase II small subunit [Candidatus Haiyanarchaeum thermophilum]MCW1306408.1 DNA-directed DNA polymerase II small subunit [Candidatus Haiyanarchaeum thermophilum]MCW1307294.1 DNA-directed DNA polymerase II small subunit [Candidatus Haiyanarchaeum thermophilum]
MEILKKFLNHGYLVSPELDLNKIEDVDAFLQFVRSNYRKGYVINNQVLEAFLLSTRKVSHGLKILFNFEEKYKKVGVNDFVSLYNDRYHKLKEVICRRSEARGTISISKALKSSSNEVFLVGMIKELRRGKGWVRAILEDPTGSVPVMIRASEKTEELVEDEVIGVYCIKRNGAFFSEAPVFPDIPEREMKKLDEDLFLCFIADIHYGSKMFLREEFEEFINFLKGKSKEEKHREIAEKIKYIFILGDIVDGIGVYPEQERELEIPDIYSQYAGVSEYLKQIPEEKQIIIIPGNHDVVRMAEPQPPLYRDVAKPLHELKNVILLSNPAMVNVEAKEGFDGFNILLYHGYSLDYLISNVNRLKKYGYEKPELAMELLLRKRHLAPTHGSTLIAPLNQDHLTITTIPDIFATAHIHKAAVGTYKGVLNICCSCWQARTLFQEKVGHIPEPGRVFLVNLKNMGIRILKFV